MMMLVLGSLNNWIRVLERLRRDELLAAEMDLIVD